MTPRRSSHLQRSDVPPKPLLLAELAISSDVALLGMVLVLHVLIFGSSLWDGAAQLEPAVRKIISWPLLCIGDDCLPNSLYARVIVPYFSL